MKIRQFAKKFSRTDQWVRNLIGLGYIPKPVKMQIDFEAAAIGVFNYQEDKIKKAEGARSQLATSRAALAEEDRLLKRQKRMKGDGELVDVKQVELVWTGRKAAVRQTIEQLPISKKDKDDICAELEGEGVKDYL